MPDPMLETLHFRRHHFSARLPVRYRYTESHFWLDEVRPGDWCIGLTSFATRMLGEIVEFDFEVEPGETVAAGDELGWIEGFKAVSTIYCVAAGRFGGHQPLVKEDPELICSDPLERGWLYSIVEGEPDPGALDVRGYIAFLEQTIDRMRDEPWKSPGMEGS
ncbi:MAG: glycine cleavage system protein H [Planctomycetes bacterium]|nr:glycine cleavage system protein H [Planctomycetota bacterium]